ncbi:hypothetical protein ILUMI_20145 [Ignelater luminosus]|uniref:Uncharacterized protein n=1 Tax=Ignelater luminosus TaxID=2038154 RepID=A0A8K0CEU4_IGNLU|nr:hypothetical protein ILUMI_20145 [Ignelater luminosus]
MEIRKVIYDTNYSSTATTNISNEIEEEYGNIKGIISKVAREVLGTESEGKEKLEPPWMSNEIKDMIKEKNNSYKRWLPTKMA